MNRRQAEDAIRSIATGDTRDVLLSRHAKLRDANAGKAPLTRAEIDDVLRSGRIVEGPMEDIRIADGWKFTMAADMGGRRLCVAGVFVPETRIFVITAYEDLSARLTRRRPCLGPDVE